MNELFSSNSTPPITQTLNLDLARTFVAVCETRNFRKASERVHRSPSAVSLQIGKLEEQLGCVLLHRDARNVTLTEEGDVLLNYARRLLDLSDEALRHFRRSDLSGTIRFSTPLDLGSSIVPELLRRFSRGYPNVSVDVRLEASAAAQARFGAGKADIALFSEDQANLSVPAQAVHSEDLCWLCAKGGDAAETRPLPISVAESGCSWRNAALAALDQAQIPYRIAYSSDTSYGQIAAVRADLAVAPLPKTMISRDVVAVPTAKLPSIGRLTLFLARRKTALTDAFAENLVCLLKQYTREGGQALRPYPGTVAPK